MRWLKRLFHPRHLATVEAYLSAPLGTVVGSADKEGPLVGVFVKYTTDTWRFSIGRDSFSTGDLQGDRRPVLRWGLGR